MKNLSSCLFAGAAWRVRSSLFLFAWAICSSSLIGAPILKPISSDDSHKPIFDGMIPPTPPSSPALSVVLKDILNDSYRAQIQTRLEAGSLAPLFWNLEISGVDFANEEMASEKLEPVSVVMTDGPTNFAPVKKLSLSKEALEAIENNRTTHFKASTLSPLQILPHDYRSWISAQTDKIPLKFFDNYLRATSPAHPGHGSHVAGIIGGNSPFGISPYASIEAIDVFQGVKELEDVALLSAYRMLRERKEGVSILNLSHGLAYDSRIKEELENLKKEKDTLCVVAAGNYYSEVAEKSLTRKLSKTCLIVGAFGFEGTKSDFSTYGNEVSLLAPGEKIFSYGKSLPWREGQSTDVMSGSSMATPFVSGAAAFIKAILPHADADLIRSVLETTALDLGLPGKDEISGYGLVNVYRAVHLAHRLRSLKPEADANTLRLLLLDPALYDNSKEIAEIKYLRSKLSISQAKENITLLRKEILLEGRIERMKELVSYYWNRGQRNMARTLALAALNRGHQTIDGSELDKVSEMLSDRIHLSFLLKQKKAAHDETWPKAIANEALLKETYRLLPGPVADAYRTQFIDQQKRIDPKGVDRLLSARVSPPSLARMERF